MFFLLNWLAFLLFKWLKVFFSPVCSFSWLFLNAIKENFLVQYWHLNGRKVAFVVSSELVFLFPARLRARSPAWLPTKLSFCAFFRAVYNYLTFGKIFYNVGNWTAFCLYGHIHAVRVHFANEIAFHKIYIYVEESFPSLICQIPLSVNLL